MTRQYSRPVMASVHKTAKVLHAAGVMDKQIMRKSRSPASNCYAGSIKVSSVPAGRASKIEGRSLSGTRWWDRNKLSPSRPPPAPG